MDYVYKNDFRKVKLREMESGLAKTVVPALTFPWLFSSLFFPRRRKVMPVLKATEIKF